MTSSAKTLRAPDMVRVYAAALAMAWCKYQDTFGETPHGTLDQMSALVELAGGEKVLTRVAALKRKRTGRRLKSGGIDSPPSPNAAAKIGQSYEVMGIEQAPAPAAPDVVRQWEWPVNTVGKLITNLQTLPPEMSFYTAYFVEIDGAKIARVSHPSLSRETIFDWKVQKYSPNEQSLVMWATPLPPAPGRPPARW